AKAGEYSERPEPRQADQEPVMQNGRGRHADAHADRDPGLSIGGVCGAAPGGGPVFPTMRRCGTHMPAEAGLHNGFLVRGVLILHPPRLAGVMPGDVRSANRRQLTRGKAMQDMRVRMLLMAGLLTAAACGGDDQDDEVSAADAAQITADSAAVSSLLTPIRGMSLAEVEFADMAAQRAGSPAVRRYAQTVAADHRALIAALDSVAQSHRTALTET